MCPVSEGRMAEREGEEGGDCAAEDEEEEDSAEDTEGEDAEDEADGCGIVETIVGEGKGDEAITEGDGEGGWCVCVCDVREVEACVLLSCGGGCDEEGVECAVDGVACEALRILLNCSFCFCW